jgi:N-acetylglucosaminyldiphosphoundecaprenol N-acetyl-beta-D-mannosaminyltransferase
MTPTKALLFGLAIDRMTLSETVDRCESLIQSGRPSRQFSINAAKVVAASRNKRLRSALASADVLSADGQSIVWASRLLRDPLPERVAGIDLMNSLIGRATERGFSVYFLGARQDVLDRAIATIKSHHPGLRIAGSHNGYFDDASFYGIAEEIRQSRADILFVGMSSPKKEYLIADLDPLNAPPLSVGVGGAIDVAAAVVRRAPIAFQRTGLEWLFRVAQEPRRLLWRYTTTNTQFVMLLLRELVSRRTPDGCESE